MKRIEFRKTIRQKALYTKPDRFSLQPFQSRDSKLRSKTLEWLKTQDSFHSKQSAYERISQYRQNLEAQVQKRQEQQKLALKLSVYKGQLKQVQNRRIQEVTNLLKGWSLPSPNTHHPSIKLNLQQKLLNFPKRISKVPKSRYMENKDSLCYQKIKKENKLFQLSNKKKISMFQKFQMQEIQSDPYMYRRSNDSSYSLVIDRQKLKSRSIQKSLSNKEKYANEAKNQILQIMQQSRLSRNQKMSSLMDLKIKMTNLNLSLGYPPPDIVTNKNIKDCFLSLYSNIFNMQ